MSKVIEIHAHRAKYLESGDGRGKGAANGPPRPTLVADEGARLSQMVQAIVKSTRPSQRSRTAVKIAIDLCALVLAVFAAYATRFESVPRGTYGVQMLVLLPCLPLVRLSVFRFSGVYAMSWRLFGLREALQVSLSVVLVSAVLVLARVALPLLGSEMVAVPLGVIALEGLFGLVATGGVRVVARLIDEHTQRELILRESGKVLRRALLVGAGRAGRLAARELRHRPDAGYEVIGFLDDDPNRQRQVIEGVKVLGTTARAAEIAAETRAEVLILTIASAKRSALQGVVERCSAAGLPVRTVPGFYELLGGKVAITKIRPLRIEDLLGREVVDFDATAWSRVIAAFAGKRILVTGAGGSIGSELCRQLADLDPTSLILVENNENNLFEIELEMRAKLGDRVHHCLADIRDASEMHRVFGHHRPEVVFHAAAFKHVPMMEHHPSKAIDNNVCGTRTLVDVADAHAVDRFLFISTDKAVNPANVMGASKRMAEMVVQSRDGASRTKFCCVRFGNVLGSRGSVLHTFQRQIAAGGPVTVTHPDVTRFFMTIPEAVRLVIQAAAVGAGGEVFLLDMGEPVKILEMAKQMIRLAGLSEDEIPVNIVGLRPGEKLYEELLRDDEGSIPSEVAGVFVARLASVRAADIEPVVGRLARAAAAGDAGTIRSVLGSMTGYRPDESAPAIAADGEAVAVAG